MEPKKKLLMVILNFNNYNATINCVKQMLSYTTIQEETDIVIVDNNSTNDSYNILRKAFLTVKNVILLKTTINGGYSYGNNFGIRYACNKKMYKYIGITNPDVSFNGDIFKPLINTLDTHSELAMISCRNNKYNDFNIKEQAWNIPTSNELWKQHFLLNRDDLTPNTFKIIDTNLIQVELIPGSFFIIDAVIFKEIGYFDENVFMYNEEIILGIKLKKINKKCALLLSEYYLHNHPKISHNEVWKSYKHNFKSIVRKYSYTYASRKYVCQAYYGSNGLFKLKLVNVANKVLLYLKHLISLFKVPKCQFKVERK